MTDVARPAGDLHALSDAELITSVRAGSDAAFSVLYERHGGSARAAARSIGAPRSDVDDLVSEAFTRVLAALRRGGGPEVAFRPYLMTCVRNAWYDKARKDGRVDIAGEVPEDVNLALLNVPPDSEDARMAAAAFASLPERWQMVLWHTEVEGLPAAEIAPMLGLAPNAVAALAYRAREGLRQAYLQAHLQLPPPDTCRVTVMKLGAYVRDGLSTRDRRQVDEHLKGCERCTALLLELQEVSTSLRGVLVPVLLGVSGTVFVSHMAAGGGVGALLRWRPRGAKAQVALVAGAAAVVVGALVAAAALSGGGAADKVTAAVPPPVPSAPARTTASSVVVVPPLPNGPPVTTVPPVPVAAVPTSPAPAPVSVVPLTPSTTSARRTTTTRAPSSSTSSSSSSTSSTSTSGTSTTTTTSSTTTTTTTSPATTTTTLLLPPPVPLTVTANAVGPAYAGLGASVQLSTGIGSSAASALGLGQSALAPAGTLGPVTITVEGARVADWDVPGCSAGGTCVLPAATTSLLLRLDLTGIPPGAPVPVTVTTRATGASPATVTVAVTPLERPAGLSSVTVDHAGVAMAANTVLACLPVGGARCGANNNHSDLAYVDVGAGTLNSSSADLALPKGATILRASLRWGGNPAGAPDPDSIGTVLLTLPDGSTTTVQSTDVRRAGVAAYAASADVTKTLGDLADPNGRYTVADVQTGVGPGQFGGWALVVVYRLPTEPLRAIALFDDPSPDAAVLTPMVKSKIDYSLTGLAAPKEPTAVQFGVVAYEGDRGITGDRAMVGKVSVGAANNFFDSSIAVGDAPRLPPNPNQYGFDAHLASVKDAFGPADKELTVTFATETDTVYLGGVVLAVPL